jgi:hypothetical protein
MVFQQYSYLCLYAILKRKYKKDSVCTFWIIFFYLSFCRGTLVKRFEKVLKTNVSVENCAINKRLCVGVMVINATFSNISALSWQSVLSVVEVGVPGENHRHACHKSLTNLSRNVVSGTPRH